MFKIKHFSLDFNFQNGVQLSSTYTPPIYFSCLCRTEVVLEGSLQQMNLMHTCNML